MTQEEKLKKLLDTVTELYGTTEILIGVTSEELFEIGASVQNLAKISNPQSKSNLIKGIGGNITTYSYAGSKVHLKIIR